MAILLVVVGHILQSIPSNVVNRKIYSLIYSFHMPLFFIISGYCLNTKRSLPDMLKRKLKGLGCWYLFFCLLWFFFLICTKQMVWNKDILYNTLFITSDSMFSVYWFIPALIIAEICALLIIKYSRMKIIFGVVLYCLAIIFNYICNFSIPLVC